MFKASMSQAGHIPSNRNPSDYSLEPSEQPSHRHRVSDIRSQNLHKNDKQLEQIEYKCDLLRLMMEVRLEEMGYQRTDIRKFAETEVGKIVNIGEIEVSALSEIACYLVSLFLFDKIADHQRGELRPVLPERSARSSQQDARDEGHRQEPNFMLHSPPQRLKVLPPLKEVKFILCSICYIETSEFIEQGCGHAFCQQCIRGYIQENMDTGNFVMTCPQYSCPVALSRDHVQKMLTKSQFKKFFFFWKKNEQQLNPDNKFCSKPDCGQILQRQQSHLLCHKCGSQFCEICLQKDHRGTNCDIALAKALEQTYQAFKIKKCPSCKSPIEKSDGCNHMNCKKCKHQFCWICLRPYSTGHYKYYNCCGCPGMQFQDEEDYYNERAKQVCFYLFLPVMGLVFLACFLAAIPIYMLGCLFYKPFEWIGREENPLMEERMVKCCCNLPSIVHFCLMWLLYQPRTILYAVFVAPIKVSAMFCSFICRAFE